MINTILLVFAFVLLICAAFNVSLPRVHLGWFGLALFILTIILGTGFKH